MIEQPTANNRPALDEESFTRLLAAAYVMQEHQDRVRTKVSPADLTEIIAQIVDTQHEIQTQAHHGNAAFTLIAKRLCSLTRASGVVISTTSNGSKLLCRAGVGSAAAMSGSEIDQQQSLAAACLKTGMAFQSPLAQTDPRLNSAQCRKLGAHSLLAVPLYHDGRVEGTIELYFPQISGFGDTETRAAELMAGVAAEVIADGSEQELKEELESERASVLQALEVLEPELQKIAEGAIDNASTSADVNTQSELCRACGHAFVGNETFCGVCGASRVTGMYPGAALQSKWAVLWERHLTAGQDGMPLFRKTPPQQTVLPVQQLPEELAREVELPRKEWEEDLDEARSMAHRAPDLDDEFSSPAESDAPESQSETTTAITPWQLPGVIQEAQGLSGPEAFSETTWNAQLQILREHAGDTCLALACLVLFITLLWAFWTRGENTSLANVRPPSISVVKRHPRPKPPQLSLFEKALVGLGLAVAPPTPEYMGDPNIKVWEDLQTALYYCPDADLYGNTAKGRFTTQTEAQQDAFEPALRKPCD